VMSYDSLTVSFFPHHLWYTKSKEVVSFKGQKKKKKKIKDKEQKPLPYFNTIYKLGSRLGDL